MTKISDSAKYRVGAGMKITELLLESLLLEDAFDKAVDKFVATGADLNQAKDYMNRFRQLANNQRFAGVEKDINYWTKQSFDQFKAAIEDKETTQSKTAKQKQERAEQGRRVDLTAELGLKGKGWDIYIPLDKAAACYKTDKGTDWCVAKREHEYFEQYIYKREYNAGQPVVLVYCLRDSDRSFWAILLEFRKNRQTKSAEKFDYNYYEKTIYSKLDKVVGKKYFTQKTGLDSEAIASLVSKKLDDVLPKIEHEKSQSIPYWLLSIKGRKRNPELEKLIAASGNSKYFLDYFEKTKIMIPGGAKLFSQTPSDAVNFSEEFLGKAWSKLTDREKEKFGISDADITQAERVIAQDFESASQYAIYHKIRMPQIEAQIAKDPEKAADYAVDVLRKPWPAAEPAIATNRRAAAYYVTMFKKPFPAAESVLATTPSSAYFYAVNTKRRFPAGESVIARDGYYAVLYAFNVLRTAWSDPELGIKPKTVSRAERSIEEDILYGSHQLKQYQRMLKAVANRKK